MCPSHESEDVHKRKEQKRNPFLTTLKVFRYSFSEAVPIFFNRLKSGFFLVRWLWIEICENVVLSKIDVTMTIINKKL